MSGCRRCSPLHVSISPAASLVQPPAVSPSAPVSGPHGHPHPAAACTWVPADRPCPVPPSLWERRPLRPVRPHLHHPTSRHAAPEHPRTPSPGMQGTAPRAPRSTGRPAGRPRAPMLAPVHAAATSRPARSGPGRPELRLSRKTRQASCPRALPTRVPAPALRDPHGARAPRRHPTPAPMATAGGARCSRAAPGPLPTACGVTPTARMRATPRPSGRSSPFPSPTRAPRTLKFISDSVAEGPAAAKPSPPAPSARSAPETTRKQKGGRGAARADDVTRGRDARPRDGLVAAAGEGGWGRGRRGRFEAARLVPLVPRVRSPSAGGAVPGPAPPCRPGRGCGRC